ncbi:MFS transporter [Pseudonocardia sp. MCCB 268]|nr:MFS transporter [Pseudonocardia cytotoxica]
MTAALVAPLPDADMLAWGRRILFPIALPLGSGRHLPAAAARGHPRVPAAHGLALRRWPR